MPLPPASGLLREEDEGDQVDDEQDDDDDDMQAVAPRSGTAAVVESAVVTFEPSPSEHALGATTRTDFAIPIARLRRPHQEWQRDKNFRPPRAK